MKISRSKTRASLLLLITGGAGLIAGAILPHTIYSLIGLVLLVVGAAMLLLTSRCPYCRSSLREPSWAKRDAGYCPKCGNKLEYDD